MHTLSSLSVMFTAQESLKSFRANFSFNVCDHVCPARLSVDHSLTHFTLLTLTWEAVEALHSFPQAFRSVSPAARQAFDTDGMYYNSGDNVHYVLVYLNDGCKLSHLYCSYFPSWSVGALVPRAVRCVSEGYAKPRLVLHPNVTFISVICRVLFFVFLLLSSVILM